MFTLAFWKDAAARAVWTAAQSLLALWGATGIGIVDIDPGQALSVAGMAALLSVLKSLVATRVGDPDSPTFSPADEVELPEHGGPDA